MSPDETAVCRPAQIFFSYAHADEPYRVELEKHLSALRRQGLVESWHDRMISPGSEWNSEIDSHIDSAHVVLLLVSSDFIASEYCFHKEMERALKRHQAGEARVIPIILRPVDWSTMPFGRLQALPKDAKAISLWKNQDEALLSVSSGIRDAIKHIAPKSGAQGPAGASGEWTIRIQGNLSEFSDARIKEVLATLRKLSHDFTLSIRRKREGSVLLTFSGSLKGFRKIQAIAISDLSIELRARILEITWDSPTDEECNSSHPAPSIGGRGRGKRIYCGNLSFQATEDDVRTLFSAYGEVTDVHIVMDRETGRARGFGFVEMATGEAAEQAIRALDGKNVAGRPLKVNEAQPREGRHDGRGDFGQSGGGVAR